MNQVNTLRIIIAWTFIVIAHAQFKYLCEFLDPKVFAKCEEYPENFLDQFLNMSELSIQQTTEGDLLVNGSIFVTKTLPNDLPVVLETYKKERGTWQPTVFTSKRSSLCKATFDNTEVWASYWENTPKEQQSCPLTEGQRIDMDISKTIALNIPIHNADGQYLSRMEIGDKSGDFYICTDVILQMHRL